MQAIAAEVLADLDGKTRIDFVIDVAAAPATRDVELRGQQIAEGDKLAMFYLAANRDEQVFDNPLRFDVLRQPNNHLGFGGPGAHFCLGAHLARRETTVMFRGLFARYPGIHAVGPPDLLMASFIHGSSISPPTSCSRFGEERTRPDVLSSGQTRRGGLVESKNTETLIIDVAENGVVTVTMNRPEKMNAANFVMWTELRETWDEIAAAPDVRCVVMTGAGKAFCSGADLGGSRVEMHQLQAMNMIHKTVQALYSIMVPVVAKVNGVAAGAGMNMALACDLIVASDQARFSEIFARRGLSMDFGGTWILPRMIGLHKAKELAFFGDVISAEQAAEFGIINKLVPHAELDTTVSEWTDRLAAGPPLALAMTKRLLTMNATADFSAALEAEGYAQTVNFGTSDTKEAVAAFLEKRDPEFHGR